MVHTQAIHGGSINKAYKITLSSNKQYFCKINSASLFPHLFRKEAFGLELIRKQPIIIVPQVILFDAVDDYQILLLEWIESGLRTASFWKMFGEQLAAFHGVTNPYFGLDQNNYMGSVVQDNTPDANWNQFFVNKRLEPLVLQCYGQQLLTSKHREQFKKLYQKLDTVFSHDESPSLLHGDLWSQNFMCNHASHPVLIDPAVYYGHPCMDVGMTTLFGGFNKTFYEAYRYHVPFPHNYKEQWKAAILYPLLIHLHLFGKSYLALLEETLDRFV